MKPTWIPMRDDHERELRGDVLRLDANEQDLGDPLRVAAVAPASVQSLDLSRIHQR